jgi:hypothetical protein
MPSNAVGGCECNFYDGSGTPSKLHMSGCPVIVEAYKQDALRPFLELWERYQVHPEQTDLAEGFREIAAKVFGEEKP